MILHQGIILLIHCCFPARICKSLSSTRWFTSRAKISISNSTTYKFLCVCGLSSKGTGIAAGIDATADPAGDPEADSSENPEAVGTVDPMAAPVAEEKGAEDPANAIGVADS
jgi:hypothetical protein